MKRPEFVFRLGWYGACTFGGEVKDSRFWRQTASRVARRLNIGRWLERALPVWAGVSVLVACMVLILRNRGVSDLTWVWLGVFAAFVALGLVVYGVDSRRHLTSTEQALVWLEHRLRLNNRLTAASAGIGAWPEPRPEAVELLEWRPGRVLPAPLFSVALMAAAAFIPVSPDREPLPLPIASPLAWTEMERWLEDVKETELVDEQAVEAWERRVESLESQPQEEWYSHSSLEAGDSLREELASELRALERGLSEAESSLTELLELAETANASPEKRRLSQKRLAKALDDLDLATLPLSRKVKRQLMTLARERDVRRMTKEQLEQLRERLRERRYANLPRPGDEAYAFLSPGSVDGEMSSGRPGKGGVNRGPGSAPIELAEERTELGSSRIEDVIGHEPLGTELGETVAVGIGEHDNDTSGFRGGRDAGAVAATGEGGELVWSQTLTPEERRVLKKYFK
ncbi:MAG: hypothetical protein BMS9Abin37_2009 [Acidobacteriota bacterium]|nr:MAG: hypothetical protein BMS9Abin37_2009 [Acidobacteriota bacterium]